jgi:hypothetical protein
MDSERIAFNVHGRENMAGLLPALRTVTSFRRVLRTLENFNADLAAKASPRY